MTRRAIAFALASAAAGCVHLSESDCRSTDWYQLGYRDGIYGIQRQDEVYAFECSKVAGPAPDRGRYVQGWQDGLWEFERRKIHGGSE